MNFALDTSVFQDVQPATTATLLLLAAGGRHRFEVPCEAQDAFRSWVEAQGPLMAFLEQLERDSARAQARDPSAITVNVSARADSAWSTLQISVNDAIELAQKPFRVFLENRVSDRRFFLALLDVEDRRWLEQLEDREWLELEGCGGIGELTKRAEWALRHASRRIRAAAVSDSDAVEIPAAQPEAASDFRARLTGANLRAYDVCTREPVIGASGLLHHVLRRRCIESYLPDRALDRWVNDGPSSERQVRQRKVDALRAARYRHQYNMKRGHEHDRRRNPPPSWLPNDPSNLLEVGFGPDISEYFDRVNVTELDRDARAELEPFLNELLRRLR